MATLVNMPESKIPLAFNEGRLLEVVFDELSKQKIPQEDIQELLSSLRTELYSDILDDSVKNLHSITLNCRKCPNVQKATLPWWNTVDPDVVFVVEAPFFNNDHANFLANILKDTGFSSANICLTFTNRCQTKDRRKYTKTEIDNCSPFLQNEIQLLKPKLIVTFGLISFSSLVNADVKLASERGKIHWLGPWAIMPTYSPAYVLGEHQQHLQSTFIEDINNAYQFIYN